MTSVLAPGRAASACVLAIACGLTAGCLPVHVAGRGPSFVYLQEKEVRRTDLATLQTRTIVRLPAGEARGPGGLFRFSGGTVAWLGRRDGATVLGYDAGGQTGSFPLPPGGSFMGGFSWEAWPEGISKLAVISDRPVDGFLVSPDGSRIAWNVNRVDLLDSEREGISRNLHLVYLGTVGGQGEGRLVLAQEYDVPGFNADHMEWRRLLRWSGRSPDRIFFTRYEAGQLHDSHVGLYRLDTRTGTTEAVDGSVERILDLSQRETFVAHTANDTTCCGGINYTNNWVRIRAIATGAETTVFDEWREFGNPTVDPGDGGAWEEYTPANGSFSPDGSWLAFTVLKAASGNDRAVRTSCMSIVCDAEGGARRAFLPERRVLGWADRKKVILGSCRSDGMDDDLVARLFLYAVDEESERELPVRDIFWIGVEADPDP